MHATGGAVEGGLHVGPEFFDQGGSTGLGEISRVTVDVDDEELLDTKAGPHGAEALSLELLLVDLGGVGSQVNGGIDLIGAVDVDQVIDAVDEIKDLVSGALVEHAELVDASDAARVDAAGVHKEGGGSEVALGLTDASSAEDPLESVFKLDAIGGDGEHGCDSVEPLGRGRQIAGVEPAGAPASAGK